MGTTHHEDRIFQIQPAKVKNMSLHKQYLLKTQKTPYYMNCIMRFKEQNKKYQESKFSGRNKRHR